jgi:hypothetical protein
VDPGRSPIVFYEVVGATPAPCGVLEGVVDVEDVHAGDKHDDLLVMVDHPEDPPLKFFGSEQVRAGP